MRDLLVGSTKNKKSAVVRAIAFNSHLITVRSFRVNIFQLAKRVRRATRRGHQFVRMINANQERSAAARWRAAKAQAALARCERVLRLANYYLPNHNVPCPVVQATLAKFQAA